MSAIINRLSDQALAKIIKCGVKGRIYEHYKGGFYRVVNIATNSTNGCGRSGEWLVYKTLKTTNPLTNPITKYWCQEARDFFSAVSIGAGKTQPRFTKKSKRFKVKQDPL
jgi:hypothetical protein